MSSERTAREDSPSGPPAVESGGLPVAAVPLAALGDVLDSLPDQIAVLDRHGVILAVNRAWLQFAASGQASLRLIDPVGTDYLAVCARAAAAPDGGDAAEMLAGLRAVLEGRATQVDLEYACHSADQQRWFRATVTPLQGDQPGAVIRHVNITESKRVEFALAARQRALQLVANNVPGCVSRLDADLRYVFVNKGFQQTFGCTYERAIGRSMHEIVGESLFAQVEPHVRLALTGRPAYCEAQRAEPDGRTTTWLVNFVPDRDAAGAVVGLFTIGVDISERRQAEEALRISDAALKSISQGVLICDVNGRVMAMNAAFTAMTGYVEADLVGRQLPFSSAPTTAPATARAIQAARDRGTVFAGEIVDSRKDGSTFWNDLTVAPVRDAQGRLTHFIVVTRDISERKRVEAELEQHRHHLEELVYLRTAELASARDAAQSANRAKTAFLAHMSHELRTPLHGIMGMTELALRRAIDPRQAEQLRASTVASRHLLGIIDDILDVSRIESGQLTLEERVFSVGQLLDEVLVLEQAHADAKGLQLMRIVDADVPDALWGDPLRLRQVLRNFVANAIKFSERGRVDVRARAIARDRRDVTVRIEVCDEGPGVAPEQLERLFQPFSQVDASNTRRHGGAGLGLTIARRLARLMGGEVGVVSEVGSGSRFWLVAPLRLPASVARAKGGAVPPTVGPGDTGPTGATEP